MKRKREPIPPQWDTLFYKNELSLDVSPVIGFAIATYRSNESLALTYRRFLGKKDAIRIGTRHNFNSRRTTEGLPPFEQTITLDSTYTETNRTTHYYSPDIRFGYEHRFGGRRMKFVLGFDILAGIERNRTIETMTNYKVNYFMSGSGSIYTILERDNTNPLQYRTNTDYHLKIGITPIVGLQIHLTKRFSLNASFMYDVYTRYVIEPKIQRGKFSWGAGADAIIADVSLTFHF